jgi:hypothetical protein
MPPLVSHKTTQRAPASAAASKRVIRVGAVAVEEMLGVEHDLVDARRRVTDGIRDHLDVFVAFDAERDVDLEIPGLADDAHGLGPGRQQRGERGVVIGRAPGAPRHAERGDGRGLDLGKGREKRIVDGIGAGPPALDVVDAERVELAGDLRLVQGTEVDALGLRAVSQRAVVDVDSRIGHCPPSSVSYRKRRRMPNNCG